MWRKVVGARQRDRLELARQRRCRNCPIKSQIHDVLGEPRDARRGTPSGELMSGV